MSSDEVSEDGETWISWFCGLQGHEMLCEVDRSYIEDSFNLYGLRPYVTNFKECLDLILDRSQIDTDTSEEDLQHNAEVLYGMIHARYIITIHGLETMSQKYDRKDFGECPRTLCRGQPVLPVGIKDEPSVDTVRLYCPKCQQMYNPPPPSARNQQNLDGAYFGTTFAHLFFMTYEDKVPPPCREVYVPRVFGFKINPRSACFPQPVENGEDQQEGGGNHRGVGGSVEAFGGKRTREGRPQAGGLTSDEDEEEGSALRSPASSSFQRGQASQHHHSHGGGGGGGGGRGGREAASSKRKRER